MDMTMDSLFKKTEYFYTVHPVEHNWGQECPILE